MTKKTIIPTSTEDTMSFEAIIENLHKANSGMPDISESDKIGGKLTKNIVPLVDKAIKYAPKFEKELPREFNVQEVADAEALIKANKLKITALESEVKRLEDINIYVGIQMAKDYRIIYEASVKAYKKDASLKNMSDELGTPYQRAALSDEKKAELAQKRANKAVEKAAELAAKVAAKNAK